MSKILHTRSYLTIDEQLLAFSRCAFRMFMAKKPAKYGLKIFIHVTSKNIGCHTLDTHYILDTHFVCIQKYLMMCDIITKYLINTIPYLGKTTDTNSLPSPTYFVKEISQPVHNTNRNLFLVNWFTSVPLLPKLMLERTN